MGLVVERDRRTSAMTQGRRKLFENVDKQIKNSISAIESESITLSRNLREMAQDREDGKPLWSEGGFRSLKAYCEDRSIGKTHFHNLMLAGEVLNRLECKDGSFVHHPVNCIPISERQIRPMAGLVSKDPEAIPQVWDYAIEVAADDGRDQPEQRHVQQAMREYNAKGGDLQATRRKYSIRERDLKADCENGWTVVANISTDSALISWAESKGKYVYVGRGSKWGNPFKMGDDGDREAVCDCYKKHYVPYKPSILSDLDSLAGMVLGCYCSPQRCHAETLASLANKES